MQKKNYYLESVLDLNASNVWGTEAQELLELWQKDIKEEGFSSSEEKVLNVIRLAFDVYHFDPKDDREVMRYSDGNYVILPCVDKRKGAVAIRKKEIRRITDLSYENIKHITASDLLKLIEGNFGGGWDSISLTIKDIIESAFDISTTTLPASRIHAAGGTLERKVADGYEALEIAKGTWVEAIFAKKREPVEKLRFVPEPEYDEDGNVIGSRRAIDGVDIDIPQGSFVAVLGHNGSGKSTLAKHMNAILVPTDGTMWVDGKDTKDMEKLWEIRQSAGMVFQNPDNQIIGTVVEEDVGFGPENLGVPTKEIWKRVEDSLRAVGMLDRRKDSPNKLSGGQKQRVAIAGVIAMEPKCIVLDEPTAMLDPNGRKEVISAVEKLRREKNVTVILITHYMEEVVDADQVFVMDDGRIVMHGTPREIFSRVDELKKYRMDVPQVTMLADELIHRGVDLPKGILRREELVEALCRLR